MTSLLRPLCWLGYHYPVPAETVYEKPAPWLTTGTNAVCKRCGKRSWFNWPPEAQ